MFGFLAPASRRSATPEASNWSITTIVPVGIGAAIGAATRWQVVESIEPTDERLATFFLNVFGSAVAGFALGLGQGLTQHWRLGVITGFCGGLTTFSSYAVTVATLLDQGYMSRAVASGLITPCIVVLAAGLAFSLGRFLAPLATFRPKDDD